ncbi:MAG: hypothetical protein ISS25_01690 [Nanoarchaeota archaeon]|nr:hypothetical protein [DPANN group archaeon]MBL7116521.1 hypothetical protein [Nanoarchaeota archaeon]
MGYEDLRTPKQVADLVTRLKEELEVSYELRKDELTTKKAAKDTDPEEKIKTIKELDNLATSEDVETRIIDFITERGFDIPPEAIGNAESAQEAIRDPKNLEKALETHYNNKTKEVSGTFKFVARTISLANKIFQVDLNEAYPAPIIISTFDLLSRVADNTATTGLMHSISQYISNDRREKGGYKVLPELMSEIFGAINKHYDHQIEDIRSSRGSPVQIKVRMKNYNEKHLQNIRSFFSEVHDLTLQAATNPYSLDEEVKEKGVEEVLKDKIYQAAENIFGVKMNGSKSEQYFVDPSDIEKIARSEGPEGFENEHGVSIGAKFRNIRNHTKITIHTKKNGGYNSVKILFREPVDIHTDSMMLQLTSLAIKRGFVDRPELMDGTNKTHRCIERGYLRTQ